MPDENGKDKRDKKLDRFKKLITGNDERINDFISIYSHNITAFTHTGSAANKIDILNDKLAHTDFDVICIQETWLTDKIIDTELIKNSPFLVYRRDRSCFDNSHLVGGGVAMFIRSSIIYNEIPLKRSKAEIQAIRINHGGRTMIILNVYIPTYDAITRRIMFNELYASLEFIKIKHPNDDIMILGDLNLSRIRWTFTDEEFGFLTPEPATFAFNMYEMAALNTFARMDLKQMNSFPNSNGVFLDFVLVNNTSGVEIHQVSHADSIDENSRNHSAIGIRIYVHSIEKASFTRTREIIKLKGVQYDLTKGYGKDLTTNALNEDYFYTNTQERMTNFSGTLYSIQRMNTRFHQSKTESNFTHPWLNNKQYEQLCKRKTEAKLRYRMDRSEISANNLAAIKREISECYKRLKINFYDEMMDNIGGDGLKFFAAMKTLKRGKTTLPLQMTFGGIQF